MLPKKSFLSIKALVSVKFFYMEELTAFLKVLRSINHKKDDLAALMEADLGEE